jgi:hypothetical protein
MNKNPGLAQRRTDRRGRALATLALALTVTSSPQARAQTPSPNATVYAGDSFVRSGSANALEALEKVPGFVIVAADPDVRGYAGAQGNVLIDGVRPASKRDDIADLLRRIPAASIDRIELVRGGAPGIDMAGFPVIANIVRRRVATTEAALEGGTLFGMQGAREEIAVAEYAWRRDDRSLEAAFSLQPELDDDSGAGSIRRSAPPGDPTGRDNLNTVTLKDSLDSSLAWRAPWAGGRLTATAALRGETTRTDTTIAGGGSAEAVQDRETYEEGEIGGRYEWQTGANKLEFVATHQLGILEALERSEEGGDSEQFEEATRTGETILRVEAAHMRSDRLELQASVEGALNRLSSQARLEENGVETPLPGSSVSIEERRAEFGLGAVWTPAGSLTLDAGLRVESSAISQTGDSPLERRFLYAKPRLAVDWDAGPATRFRLALSREVGQLDFSDFVASASLDSNVVTAGNAALAPEQWWRLSARAERRFGDEASVTLTWTHDEISDVIDRVLVVTATDVFDAPGNIGTGRRDTLSAEAMTPLDRLGLLGGRLTTSLLWRRSEVVDPVTGVSRSISGEKPFEGSITLTQDLPALRARWGITIDHLGERKTEYRFDELVRKSEAAGWTVFMERRTGSAWRWRLEATDVFGRDFTETRVRYVGARGTSAVEEIEWRNRVSPGLLKITLRRTFGN